MVKKITLAEYNTQKTLKQKDYIHNKVKYTDKQKMHDATKLTFKEYQLLIKMIPLLNKELRK